MPDSQIHLINRATDQLFPAAPEGTVISSSDRLGWRGITVELHSLPPTEYPEHYVQGHRLAVMHRGEGMAYEWKEGSHWKTKQIQPGFFFLQSHGDINAPRWFETFEMIAIALDSAFVGQSFRDAIPSERVRFQERRAEFDPIVAKFAQQFDRELTQGSYGGSLYGESLALAFSLHLLEQHGDCPTALPRPRGQLSSLQLRETIDYIHNHLSEELSLTQLADGINLSVFHFSRLFRTAIGLSPHQYVLQNRVERAKKLITVASGQSLTEIALQVGFYDQTHFGKAFKRVVGVSPKVFSRQIG